MSKSFKITVALLAALGVWLCTAIAIKEGRWQAYLIASFFLAIFFAVTATGKVSSICGRYIAFLILSFCGYIIYGCHKKGWSDIWNTIRFCATYGIPALTYMVYNISPLARSYRNKEAKQD